MKGKKLTARGKENLAWLFFVAPFIIGTICFFVYPLISSFILSFGDLDKSRPGYHIEITGFQNYYNAFFQSTVFVPSLLKELKNTLLKVPLTLVFSLIIAIMLNKLTLGKGLFRVVVLLPFLLGTGAVMQQLLTQGLDKQIVNLSNGEIIPISMIQYISADLISLIEAVFKVIVRVLWGSGVQILLFLSALQGISPALYEAAHIDGANEYEVFWKITFPMVAPITLLNMIYSIINSFTDSSNSVLNYIIDRSVTHAQFGFSSAMGWIYFAIIAIIIGLASLLIKGYIKKGA